MPRQATCKTSRQKKPQGIAPRGSTAVQYRYDVKSNLGEIKPPTKFNNNCSDVTGKKAGK